MKKQPIHFIAIFLLLLTYGFSSASNNKHSGCFTNNSDNSPVYNVKTYGAKGDGKTIDSGAINKAIEDASKNGGGTVFIPAGNYLSFSIRLKSNINLHIDQGATIIAANPKKHNGEYDYPEPNKWGDLKYQDFGHSHWHNSLIWGENLENISITGQGRIHGKGLQKWGDPTPGLGNKSIALKLCRNVLIKDISMLKCGHFGILPTGVDNFTITNLKIDTNRDAINIDCCHNVRISDCTINTPNDDAIVLKSSYALGYARATENVTITNCQVMGYDLGTFLDGTFQTTQEQAPDKGGVTGRIKLGTESNGGFKNITISNCVFYRCRGLALETVDGGILEDISISNITMRDITNAPFFLRLASRMRGPENVPVGKLRRINISNVVVYNANPRYGSMIMGVPGHKIEDVTLSNIQILVKGGAPKKQAMVEVPELEDGYPDPRNFGKIPAYGFFIRHVDGIQLNNVKVGYMEEDFRPAFVLNNVKNAEFYYINTEKNPAVSTFKMKNVENIIIKNCNKVPDTKIEKTDSKEL